MLTTIIVIIAALAIGLAYLGLVLWLRARGEREVVRVSSFDSDDPSSRVRGASGDRFSGGLARVNAGYGPDNTLQQEKNIQPG